MRKFFSRVWKAILNFFNRINPGPIAWKGANKAIMVATAAIWIIASLIMFVISPSTTLGLIPVLLGLGIAFIAGAGAILALRIINWFPKGFIWVLPGTYILMGVVFGMGSLSWQFPLFVVVFSGGLGASIFSLTKKNRSSLSLLQKIVAGLGGITGIVGLVWGLAWLSDTGFKPDPDHINAAEKSSYVATPINLANPSSPGAYELNYLTYGSGKDKQRKEFGEDATILTDSVDGSRLLDNWEGISGKLRTRYWGFDEKALPINGRVWYPEGDGPFPLALIVHGNHSMQDYSDPGYGYLGELLASQGIIMVSVDENFLNGSWTDIFTDGLDEENDARGWLLLEHLKNWKKWNSTPGSIFHNKVDMSNLAVMGHSRGGEAAAVAAFLNKLSYYPDDAKQKFDFKFNIKAVVAIAPVDGQYRPGEDRTPLENVNYLVIHGANDGDVQSFAGLRQYERVKFTNDSSYFKSGVYVYGANHGQFNTTWGNRDSGMPFGSLLNVDALMPKEDQETIGKVYISAFLQATLQNKKEYINLFKDYRTGKDWLPETIYLNQFESSDWTTIADFEEDLDLTTASNGSKFKGENLTVWKERLVGMKWGNKGTRAAYLGWDSLAYEADTARYTIEFSNKIDANNYRLLSFELSEGKGNTYPDKERDEEMKENDNSDDDSDEEKIDADNEPNNNSDEEDQEDSEKDEEKKAEDPLDFSICFVDQNGNNALIKLSDYGFLQRQLSVDVLKNKELQSTSRSEAVYNTFFVNLSQLGSSNEEFDVSTIQSMSFIFDQTKKGIIILDKIALSR